MGEKPTIHELEKILDEKGRENVTINPDGSISTTDICEERIRQAVEQERELREEWQRLAEDTISDLRRYARDEGPERRMVSVRAYEKQAAAIRARKTPPPPRIGESIEGRNL